MSIIKDIGKMVYAHGGEGETPEETLREIELKLKRYVMDLTRTICEAAEHKGSTVVDDECVRFALRLDPEKRRRVSDMAVARQEVEEGSRISRG
jgi:hypothetical protein